MGEGDSSTFGERLRNARLNAGMSQAALSEISHIPKPTLSRYENGHVSPSLKTLYRLASALGIAESTLLPNEPSPDEVFIQTLRSRGVTFASAAEAEATASDIADYLKVARPQSG